MGKGGNLRSKRATHDPIPDELNNGLTHCRGAIAMAKASGRLARCQFYVVLKDKSYLDKGYAVFGKVTKGMEVIDKIEKTPIKPGLHPRTQRPYDEPVNPPVIEKVTVRKGS